MYIHICTHTCIHTHIHTYIYIYITHIYIYIHIYNTHIYIHTYIYIIYIWKSKLCVGNSSIVKIYIIRPKPGPVTKNATPRPSGWESNRVIWITRPVLYHWATEAVAQNLGASSVYVCIYIYIYMYIYIYIYIYINEIVMLVITSITIGITISLIYIYINRYSIPWILQSKSRKRWRWN